MVLSRLEPIRGSERAASRLARSVAFVIGISLSIGCAPISDGSIDAIEPKAYIQSIMSKDQAQCLIRLYGKESAFNRYAIGNPYGAKQAYGIPQLKNPAIAHLSAVGQVNAGIDYIQYRYGTPCKAWSHFNRYGWH